eukprot:GHVS01025936.1.p1 GENE.GHVS01025936.1~~GHVS01025936.1.p1  ORF type:complete len:129 (-),score=6.92 GHVS01025936.1:297-683(-)
MFAAIHVFVLCTLVWSCSVKYGITERLEPTSLPREVLISEAFRPLSAAVLHIDRAVRETPSKFGLECNNSERPHLAHAFTRSRKIDSLLQKLVLLLADPERTEMHKSTSLADASAILRNVKRAMNEVG